MSAVLTVEGGRVSVAAVARRNGRVTVGVGTEARRGAVDDGDDVSSVTDGEADVRVAPARNRRPRIQRLHALAVEQYRPDVRRLRHH